MAGASLFRFVAVFGTLIAAATAAGVVLVGGFASSGVAARIQTKPPTAAAVAIQLEGAVNARSGMTGGGRIDQASCVAGDPGGYACSYVRTVRSERSCGVAILRWTPDADSTFTVQTAGRVALAPSACGPVTKVLHVVGTSG